MKTEIGKNSVLCQVIVKIKVRCVFLKVVVSILPNTEFGRNDHRKGAPYFRISKTYLERDLIIILDKTSLLGTFDEGNLEDITGLDKYLIRS